MTVLSDKEQVRYSRQLMLAHVGFEGQQRLKQSRVLIVGVGGLGSPVALYLAAAGVGHLSLVDDDKVDLSNLQRQILYKINHLGQGKVSAAAKTLTSVNNQITITSVSERLSEQNAHSLIGDHDVVLDCSDNFNTRYLVNRVCVAAHIPLISGAAIANKGQLICVDNRQSDQVGGCYQCVFPPSDAETALNCSNAGVFGPLLGVIGSMQAQQCLNYLLGHAFSNCFIAFDALNFQQSRFDFKQDPACKICNKK
ncbi:adenylyltransferase and sulfurtransferase [Pseudoalteromonas ulvae UL12]|uniref:Molybdopterin-synthase adenylyltransferase MoeB n=1 Tax=Pseudoalteromonas ulvae TaxID=107327 RepID=A0A244CPX4_PSEDV|nr:HesA/MoeB/ThiF family protein [Pseudoalteromonas ulvae]MBE0365110.1 adenylyltransferase and sulfurtransferase [Pseudoalteromonas ulvae UL12]OUL57661.1 molybdopterin-synthase adenylyltransferase MoeB [Pseudoalteromonas ulvae]